jgi:hypothetical protein
MTEAEMRELLKWEKTVMREVTALFVRKDSAYKALAGVDAWDVMRNARFWAPGGSPVVAHPPCAQWGVLRHMARVDPDEKALGPWAVKQVQAYGGVLEHPRGSMLWREMRLPLPGSGSIEEFHDQYGGWTLEIDQWHWGHVANKPTWLYIVGCDREHLPPMPFRPGKSDRVISTGKGLREGMPGFRSRVTQREREYTPPALAVWLVQIAEQCSAPAKRGICPPGQCAWEFVPDWYGDPNVINGTADCSFWRCNKCGDETSEQPDDYEDPAELDADYERDRRIDDALTGDA